MNSNYFYCNVAVTSKNKEFLEEMQRLSESIKYRLLLSFGKTSISSFNAEGRENHEKAEEK